MTPGKHASTLGVHVENTIRARLEQVAADEDRSLSYVAARILRNAVLAQMAAEQDAMPTAVNFATQAAPTPTEEPAQ